MTGTSLNLSLLSRGVGEVHKNGHEKVDVYLEPEDYYNFSANPDRFYLPPIRTSYTGPHHHNHSSFFDTAPLSRGPPSHSFTTRTSRDTAAAAAVASQEFRVPKTFTTRKGALLLFSEDLAQRNIGREGSRPAHHQKGGALSALNSITPASSLDSQVYLKTVEDLANSILKYGDHDRPDNAVYLKFVHARRDNFARQIRPGYSAKRYLSTWTRTWDDTVFDNVIKQGYITERSLYQYNLILPNMRRRLFYEDLSHMPQPYRLMRNMLMMPGSLSGYTFYRAPTSDFAEDSDGEQESIVLRKRPETNLRNIRVIKTKAGVQEEVAYSDLDRQSQKEVITDLLVKSAVHYALKKQEEIYEETIIRAVQSGQDGLVTDRQGAGIAVHEFDMRDAVESLLDSQNGRYAIGGDLPEIDDRSHSSDMGGSFKGGAMPKALAKHHQAAKPAWPAESGDVDKEYVGGVPVASVKAASGSEGSGSSTGAQSLSNVPVLPPIRHTLSPIRDVSRETTQPNILLPSVSKEGATSSGEVPAVHIQPATPQHSILTGGSEANATRGLVSRDAADALPDLAEEERETDAVADGGERMSKKASVASIQSSEKDKGKSSSSDIGAQDQTAQQASTSVTGTSQTGKSRPSWKGGLRKGPGSQIESVRGSTIMAPDGEIISVGGSVARGGQGAVYDVGNINDVLMPHRHEGVGTDESGVSDDEPDEWKTAKKMSISLRSDRDSHKKQYKREIDYTSGDIDATMSIYSWSYAPRENDLDPETGVIDHASSVRSLPSLRLDRGMIRDSGSGADGQHSGEGGANGSSRRSSDGENWARITERPEEEEVANIDSKEVTQEEIYIPQPPSPSPASERPKEQMAAEEEEREDGQRKGENDRKSHSTPRSRSIALQTDSEVGSHRDITTAGRVDGTPRRSGNDADDEDEGEEEEAEGKWPGRSREKETPHLDTLREESATLQSSRRPSSVSKDDISRSESKNTPALGARSKAETAPVDGGVGSEPASAPGEDGKEGGSLPSKSPVKSSAASRKSLRKSGGEEGKGTAAESRKSSVAPSRASGAATGAGPGAKSAASSAKSKIKSGVTDKSGDRSVSSSATPGGRDIAQSAVSPTKSGKLDPSRSQSKKSVSGRSSKKSSAAKQRLDSQAGGKSRATTGGGKDQNEVEEEAALDNPWDDDDDDNLENDAGIDVDNDEEGDLGGRGSQALEDVDDFRNRSTPSEANARISGEDSGGRKRGGVGLDLAIQGEQLLTPPETPGIGRRKSGPDDGSRRSSVTEKDIMDTLTDHAQRIADSVLSQPNAGEDLENDVKKAAKVWAETHPPRPISRRASVREARAEAIAEILKNRRASSAAPSVAEYRNLIKKSLTEAAAKAAGIDPDSLSTEDAEISPDLLEALASQKLTPDQIEVVSDSSGRTRIQSRTDLQGAMGGVEEGHLYIAPAKKGEEAIGKRQTSIPADKVSVMDDMEFDRISYHGTDVASEKGEKRGKSKAGSKPGSIAGGTMADLSEMEGVIAAMEGKMEGDGEPPEPEDDFLKAVQQVAGEQAEAGPPSEPKLPGSGKTTPSAVTEKAPQSELGERSPPTLPPGGPQEMKSEDLQSQKSGKSGKTGVSQKSEASKDSKKKGKKTPEEKEEPFVVGKVDQKGELEKLYGPVDPPPPPPPPPKQEEAPAPAPTPPPTEPATAAEGKALSKQEAVIPPPPPKPEKEGKAAKKAAAEIKKTEAVAPAPDTSAATAAAGQDKGLMDHKDELAALYGSVGAAPPKAGSPKGKPKEKKAKKEPLPPKKEEKKPKKTKKGKKGKKKEEEVAPPPRDPTPPPLNKEVTPTPRKESTPVSSEPKPSSPEFKTDESDLEFNFVREQSSPEGDHPAQTTKLAIPPSPPLDEEEDEKSEEEDNNLKSISNREARAAKRAAAAAKRREEVERRRREKEELARKEKEEVERKVALQREMEEERRRREEERRLMKERQREQEERERREKSEVEKKKLAEAERERRQKEEYQRKLEEMKRKQQEEELRRHELMLQKQREEEERRLAEEEMMSQMAEQERLAYEEKKRLEEEERKRKELEEKLRRAEEAKKAMEEARRLAEEMARKQAELEARLKFNKALQEEASGLGHSQEINRAFVFSYFELLQWLGLDIPEFELAKLADY